MVQFERAAVHPIVKQQEVSATLKV